MTGVAGLIMAGGRSERMRSTNGPLHKALVTVGGETLIDRNVRLLLANGVDRIVVVLAETESELRAHVDSRSREIVRSRGAVLEKFVETHALGNIGVVAELSEPGCDLAVLYVDNLCPIDLRAMVALHRSTDAALTIATHVWNLRNPFGELVVTDGRIEEYREKPVRPVRISSGTCVVAPAGAAAIPRGKPFGASELFAELHRRGLRVSAYEHGEPWIDVNDAAAIREAEDLVREHAARFR